MQRAETLLEIIHERGKRGLPLERLYRHLFNPELYLRAYGKIYRNDGSMTPGVNDGDRGRDEPEEDPGDHRCAAVRALSVDPGPTRLHRQERITGKASPAGYAHVVGQTAAGSDPLPPGSVLRAAVLRPLPRLQAGQGLSHCSGGSIRIVARDNMVHRGRHLPVFRSAGSRSVCVPSSPRTFATTASCG